MPLFLLLIFSSSCTKLDETTNLSDGDVYTEEESMARSITASNPHPDCSWTDPNCSVCQLHDSNGLHVYFYCGECVIYMQADIDLAVEIWDDNGVQLLGTLMDSDTYSGTDYFEFYFDQSNPSGYDGDLRFKSKPFPGLGQQVSTIKYYNCY
ncbi:MAG: hypothetical protein ACJATI_003957 [Halioglobus sp.]